MDLLRQLTRIPGVRGLWAKYPVGSVSDRVRFGIWKRPHYAYGVNFAVSLAKSLGLPSTYYLCGEKGIMLWTFLPLKAHLT